MTREWVRWGLTHRHRESEGPVIVFSADTSRRQAKAYAGQGQPLHRVVRVRITEIIPTRPARPRDR